ncbi:MAG: phosphoribosyl transferase [Dehalococcoidia bacterium]|nr:phosphoribosyl transferase [Dehalococcoidia bacterium]
MNLMRSADWKPSFEDRADAGRQLAVKLSAYARLPVVVMAIPNGGVPVAAEIARALNADLDVVVSRRIPMPLHPESGFGAITDDGTMLLLDDLVRTTGLDKQQIESEAERVRAEVKRRSLLYKGNRLPVSLHRQTAIIVDDGLASGITMLAAVSSVRQRYPWEIVVAVPCASASAKEQVEKVAEKVIACVVGEPDAPFAVADHYVLWPDVKDAEVISTLDEWQKQRFRRAHHLA